MQYIGRPLIFTDGLYEVDTVIHCSTCGKVDTIVWVDVIGLMPRNYVDSKVKELSGKAHLLDHAARKLLIGIAYDQYRGN